MLPRWQGRKLPQKERDVRAEHAESKSCGEGLNHTKQTGDSQPNENVWLPGPEPQTGAREAFPSEPAANDKC
jgi:hypothetical protein